MSRVTGAADNSINPCLSALVSSPTLTSRGGDSFDWAIMESWYFALEPQEYCAGKLVHNREVWAFLQGVHLKFNIYYFLHMSVNKYLHNQHLCVQSNMFIVYSTVIKTLWLELSVFGILTDSSLLLLAPSSAQQEKNLIIWIWIQNNVDIFYKITSLKITILCEVRLTHCNFYKKKELWFESQSYHWT